MGDSPASPASMPGTAPAEPSISVRSGDASTLGVVGTTFASANGFGGHGDGPNDRMLQLRWAGRDWRRRVHRSRDEHRRPALPPSSAILSTLHAEGERRTVGPSPALPQAPASAERRHISASGRQSRSKASALHCAGRPRSLRRIGTRRRESRRRALAGRAGRWRHRSASLAASIHDRAFSATLTMPTASARWPQRFQR